MGRADAHGSSPFTGTVRLRMDAQTTPVYCSSQGPIRASSALSALPSAILKLPISWSWLQATRAALPFVRPPEAKPPLYSRLKCIAGDDVTVCKGATVPTDSLEREDLIVVDPAVPRPPAQRKVLQRHINTSGLSRSNSTATTSPLDINTLIYQYVAISILFPI